MRARASLLLVLIATLLSVAVPSVAQTTTTGEPVVRVVFFFSPTCGHCEYVINDVLPGVFEQYGGEPELFFDDTLATGDLAFYEMTNGTFDILFADVTTESGASLYEADAERLGIPDDRLGVPRLVAEGAHYVGSKEIPEALPGIIEDGLARGGIPWPDIPGIADAIAAVPGMADGAQPVGDPPTGQDPTDDAAAALPSSADQSLADRFGNDPLGNSLAVLVLVAMLASLVAIPLLIRNGRLGAWPAWVVPVLALVGIGVSLYLASVETSGADAVCGPVGDCNAVQQSEYASILGIPIGVLGVIGYAVLFGGWLISRFAGGRIADFGIILAAAVAAGGTLFSIYLTFLEPFVIGATCLWCLASAVSITTLLWTTAAPGWAALRRVGSP